MKNVRVPLVMLCVLGVIAAIHALSIAGEGKTGRETLAHVIDQTGDSAHIQILHVLSGIDSFPYVDSVWFEGDTTVAEWTSPNLVRRIIPEVDTTATYACSLDCGTNIYGFEWLADNDITTVAALIDTLVDSINNVAGWSDTVTAHDSVTYIKLVSKFSQRELEGNARWTVKFSDSDPKIVEGDSIPTLSVGNLCDSLVATINGEATLADTLTAVNLADTAVQITGDRKGWTINLFAGDTAQTVLETQAAKASSSRFTDTFPLFEMYTAPAGPYTALMGDITLHASKYTGVGYGLSGSTFVRLYARSQGGTYYHIASDSAAAATATLHLAQVANDTLWKARLAIVVTVVDSATDTAATANHDLDYELTVH